MQLKSKILPARPVGAYYEPWSDRYRDYAIEPKFNGWRGLYNQKTGIGYNRNGDIATNANLMQKLLSNCKIKSPWIDCEIMGMRESIGIGTIIIIDAFDPDNPLPYDERIKEFSHIEPAGYKLKPHSLLRMPRYKHDRLKDVISEMKYNNNFGLVFEGFVMKKDSAYPFATSPKLTSHEWHKWRFS